MPGYRISISKPQFGAALALASIACTAAQDGKAEFVQDGINPTTTPTHSRDPTSDLIVALASTFFVIVCGFVLTWMRLFPPQTRAVLGECLDQASIGRVKWGAKLGKGATRGQP